MAPTESSSPEFVRLRGVIAALRTPDTGCPWDLQQTAATMAPHLLEEAFEAVEAIERGAPAAICEELGDVLMNVFSIARIAEERAEFTIDDVARTVADKLVRRHPHVFGDRTAGEGAARDAGQVLQNWDAIKRREGKSGEPRGALSGVPRQLPALLKALRIGEKAARVGFDWPDQRGPRDKLTEELGEFDAACASRDGAAIASELGDVLFSLCNLARFWGIDPEMALRGTIDRFMQRFALVERALEGRIPGASLEEMEAAWQDAKRQLAAEEQRPR